jgi:uncharacterized protein involved in propanediol utilization
LSGCSGRAEAIGHVGEILQGAVRLQDCVEPFLITLPAPSLRSQAFVTPSREWTIAPVTKVKALRAVQTAAVAWQYRFAASIEIRSPIPVSRGYGSSTADCTAAIRALAAMLRIDPSDEEVARLAAQAEGASDSTMFGMRPVAFLPVRGRCLTRFDGGWPELKIEIVELGGPPVETVESPRPDYTDAELDEFEDLLQRAATAFEVRDADALGRIASRSAGIHQRHRPHPRWLELQQRAEDSGALGVAIAHSGTAAAILLKGDR